MMFVDNPWPETTSAPGPSSDERRQRTSDLALGVLAGRDGLDLVLGQDRVPAEDRLERLVDRRNRRVDRAVAGRLGGAVLAVDGRARRCRSRCRRATR